LLLKLRGWLITTRDLPSLAGKFRLRCDYFCRVNWQNTQSAKGRKPWPSTPAPNKPPLRRLQTAFLVVSRCRRSYIYFLLRTLKPIFVFRVQQ
jgi:hypothetical protein